MLVQCPAASWTKTPGASQQAQCASEGDMLENQQQCSASTGRLLGLLRAPHARQVTSLVCEDVEGTEGCWGQGRLQSVREDPRLLTLPVFVIVFVVGGSCLCKTTAPNSLASFCMCPSPLPMASLQDHGPPPSPSCPTEWWLPMSRMRLDPEVNQVPWEPST